MSRRDRDEDLDRELRAHLDQEADEQQEAGLSAAEARDAAHRAFGSVLRAVGRLSGEAVIPLPPLL